GFQLIFISVVQNTLYFTYYMLVSGTKYYTISV
ncbi:hypothetical protein KYG_19366, partial [Acidovorax sp. NO-1]